MTPSYVVHVFGKAGCDKCKTLNQRLDSLLAQAEWSAFGKEYHDLDTVEGLVSFCQAESLNPQRIPAFVVAKRDEATGILAPLPNPRPDAEDPVCGNARLHARLGLQTDYTASGRGVLSPKMLTAVLEDARAL